MRILRIRKRLRHIRAIAKLLSPQGIDPARIRRIGYQLLWINQLGLRKKTFTLMLARDGKPFQLRTDDVGDFSLLHDLFVQEEYRPVRALTGVSTIFDFGSNIGMSVMYLRLYFPEARIVCFEPDGSNYRRLLPNLEQFRNVEARNIAVGGRDGEIEFFEDPALGVGSSVRRLNPGQRSVRVKMLSFDNLMADQHGAEIDLVKFDIEGAEYELFKHATSLNRVRAYIGELHIDLMDCTLEQFCALFKGYSIETESIGPERYSFFALRNPA